MNVDFKSLQYVSIASSVTYIAEGIVQVLHIGAYQSSSYSILKMA
jgi:hypothetical protein